MGFRLLFFALLVGLSGCAGSRTISSGPPQSLSEVNRVLDGREVQIELDDDTVAGWRVVVARDSVRFVSEAGRRAFATSQVRRISYERDRFSPGKGASIGALAGLSVVALCLLTEEEQRGWCVAYGGIVSMGGALLGALLGEAEKAGGQERVAYEGPITRYMLSAVE